MKTDRVYLGTLNRFGYDLTVIGYTEDECKKALMKEYVRAYKQRNDGSNPRKDIWDARYSDRTCYEIAEEEVGVVEMEIGKVEWL